MTFFFRPEPAEKRGTLPPGMKIRSPVRGLTPCRGPRSATANLPNPVKLTSPPVREHVGDRVEHRVDRGRRLLLAPDPLVAREHIQELSLRHVDSSSGLGVGGEPNTGPGAKSRACARRVTSATGRLRSTRSAGVAGAGLPRLAARGGPPTSITCAAASNSALPASVVARRSRASARRGSRPGRRACACAGGGAGTRPPRRRSPRRASSRTRCGFGGTSASLAARLAQHGAQVEQHQRREHEALGRPPPRSARRGGRRTPRRRRSRRGRAPPARLGRVGRVEQLARRPPQASGPSPVAASTSPFGIEDRAAAHLGRDLLQIGDGLAADPRGSARLASVIRSK